MNRKLSKLLKKENKDLIYGQESIEVKDYFISLIKKDLLNFLYNYDYIFCSGFCFNFSKNLKSIKINKWCSKDMRTVINPHNCNCSCKRYRIHNTTYKCVPYYYDIMDYANHSSILNIGIML